MTELFPNISDDARKGAELAWVIAKNSSDPAIAAKLLDAYTNYECSRSDEEGLRDFLNFFFKVKMEELMNENNSDQR